MKLKISIAIDDEQLEFLRKRKKRIGASISAQIELAVQDFIDCLVEAEEIKNME